jgi:hypothetical protein
LVTETASHVPTVTICPPGKAIGADDLRNWAGRRLAGKFGVFNRKEKKTLKRWKAEAKAAKLRRRKGRS